MHGSREGRADLVTLTLRRTNGDLTLTSERQVSPNTTWNPGPWNLGSQWYLRPGTALHPGITRLDGHMRRSGSQVSAAARPPHTSTTTTPFEPLCAFRSINGSVDGQPTPPKPPRLAPPPLSTGDPVPSTLTQPAQGAHVLSRPLERPCLSCSRPGPPSLPHPGSFAAQGLSHKPPMGPSPMALASLLCPWTCSYTSDIRQGDPAHHPTRSALRSCPCKRSPTSLCHLFDIQHFFGNEPPTCDGYQYMHAPLALLVDCLNTKNIFEPALGLRS